MIYEGTNVQAKVLSFRGFPKVEVTCIYSDRTRTYGGKKQKK